MAFFDDWRESAFLLSTAPSASAKMQELCCMWLLPRTDLAKETGLVFCDKVGAHDPDWQLTHMMFDEGADV